VPVSLNDNEQLLTPPLSFVGVSTLKVLPWQIVYKWLRM